MCISLGWGTHMQVISNVFDRIDMKREQENWECVVNIVLALC